MPLSEYDKELLALVDGRATHLPNVRKGLNKSNVGPRAFDAFKKAQEAIDAAVVDDGVPPSDPAGASVSPGVRTIIVRWAAPPADDYVLSTNVSVEAPAGTVVYADTVGGTSAIVTGLAADVVHTVSVQHVDRWGNVSGTVEAGTATPTVSVADAINFDEAVIAGALGWDNLDNLTDPDALGDGVITARAMAAQNAAAINLWVQNAAIESGKIANLSADKITAGTIAAQTITLGAGGSLVGGGGRLDDEGLHLTTAFGGSANIRPSSNSANWLTGPLGTNVAGTGPQQRYSGLAFFDYGGAFSRRGMFLGADGVQGIGNRRGMIIVRATDGNTADPSQAIETAELKVTGSEVGGQPGTVLVKGEFDIQNNGSSFIPTGNNWSASPVIKAYKVGNVVHLVGRVTNINAAGGPTNGNLDTICFLPPRFTPALFKYVLAPSTTNGNWDAQRRVIIQSGNGEIHLSGPDTVNPGQILSLDGISFTLDA